MARDRATPQTPVHKLDPKMAATLRQANTLTRAQPRHQRVTPRSLLFRLRLVIVAFGYVALSVYLGGLILEGQQVIAWLCLTLIVANLGGTGATGQTVGPIKQVIRDWIPIFGIVLAYDYSRGAADTLGMPVHWNLPIVVDEFFFGEVPTVALQRWMNIGSSPHWYEAVTATVYVSHFFLTYIMLAVLWATNRELWGRYFRSFIIVSIGGIAAYVLMPMAPPWMAAQEGLIDAVSRSSNNGWTYLDIPIANSVIDHGQRLSNNVAAFPSLHLAFSAIPLFLFWSRAKPWLRTVLVLYPTAMALSLVSSGEHYVLDLAAGLAFAGLSVTGANRLVDRKVERGQPMGLFQV